MKFRSLKLAVYNSGRIESKIEVSNSREPIIVNLNVCGTRNRDGANCLKFFK